MGCEYMLEIAIENPTQVDAVLRGIPGYESFDPKCQLYAFRRKATGTMPDVMAKIESRGLYLCDNGGAFEIVTEIRGALAAMGWSGELSEL